jgi:Domain of unknown function (DUF4129)
MPVRERLLHTVRRHPLAAAMVGIALALLAAAATPDGLPFLDGERVARIVVPRAPAVLMYMIAALGVMVVVLCVALRISLSTEVRPRRRRSIWPSLVLLLLLIALWTGSPALRDWLGRNLMDNRQIEQEAPRPAERPPAERQRSPIYGYGLTAIVGLLIVAVAVIFFIMFAPEKRATTTNGEDSAADPVFVGGIDAGIEDLEGIADPRTAVLACYARMQALAERAGIPRRMSDTPHELLNRLLQHRIDERSARTLTGLFERAKFSTLPIDEATRREALHALRDIRARLPVPA